MPEKSSFFFFAKNLGEGLLKNKRMGLLNNVLFLLVPQVVIWNPIWINELRYLFSEIATKPLFRSPMPTSNLIAGICICYVIYLTPWHFLVAYTRLSKSLCRTVRRSVGPQRFTFFTERWSNFHHCPCPTYATDAVVYTALFKKRVTDGWMDGRTDKASRRVAFCN